MALKGNHRGYKIIQNRRNYYLTNVRELSQTENKEYNCQNYVPKTALKSLLSGKQSKLAAYKN
jgi:hypothetical protein